MKKVHLLYIELDPKALLAWVEKQGVDGEDITSEVHIQLGDKSVDMTLNEFLKKVGLNDK